MVGHKLGDTNKPVMASGSAESHLPQDDKDSKDQKIVIKPLPLKTSASTPGGEFHPNSSYNTGKDSGTYGSSHESQVSICILISDNVMVVEDC